MSHARVPPSPAGRPAAAAGFLPGLAALFEPGLDRGPIERMLLAAATHRSATGFSRAHLLVWNPDRGSLEGRLVWTPAAQRSLAEALAAASRQATEGTDPDATRRLRALRLETGELDQPLVRAWDTRRSACGVPQAASLAPWSRAAGLGVIALQRAGRLYGLLVGEWLRPGRERARTVLLEALRSVANRALAVHAASAAARRHAEESAALAEFARAAVSSLNLAEVGNLLVRLASSTTGARGAALWRVGQAAGDEGGGPELASSYGPAGTRERLGRALAPLARRCAEEGGLLRFDRAVEATCLPPEVAAQVSTVAAVPLMAYGRCSGVLVVYDRAAHHPNDGMAFDAEDLAFLGALADQGALVNEQARGEDARQGLEQARRDLLRQLGRSERQAALGEKWLRAAQEARNPLASIGAFARRVHRSLADDDPNREYLEVVIREADRLERALAQPLDLTGSEGPRFRVESVNALLQAALQEVGERLVRKRVRLLKKLSPDLPPLLLDAERMSKVVRNVVVHALERVHPGGRVKVESRRVQQFVVVEVANDGASQPGEMLSELFVPFTLKGDEGADMGLALARQVVQQHGGEVRVRAEGEWSTVLALTLPIRGNQDRRKPGSDRRVTRGDRRQRTPAA